MKASRIEDHIRNAKRGLYVMERELTDLAKELGRNHEPDKRDVLRTIAKRLGDLGDALSNLVEKESV